MTHQFISPNWHVFLIHYPLAFLSGGILIEIFSFFWPRGFFRAAGRWMILLGALLSIPALAAGLYGFRAIVTPADPEIYLMPWHKVMHESPWIKQQWDFMRYHIRLNCIGTALVVVGTMSWVAATDLWRRRLYFPVLLALICGMGAFAAGGWFGGESVFRLGSAVAATADAGPILDGPTRDIKWYAPPLELHIVLAGFLAAVSVAALALTIRRLEWPAPAPEPAETIGPDDSVTHDAEAEPLELMEGDPTPAPLTDVAPPATQVVATPPVVSPGPWPMAPAVIHAGRFWMIAFLLALLTGAAGLWSVVDVFSGETLNRNWHSLLHPTHGYRLPLHALFAAIIILIVVLLAIFARYGRHKRGASLTMIVLVALFLAMQCWLGIALFYDGFQGPVYRFNPAAPAQPL